MELQLTVNDQASLFVLKIAEMLASLVCGTEVGAFIQLFQIGLSSNLLLTISQFLLPGKRNNVNFYTSGGKTSERRFYFSFSFLCIYIITVVDDIVDLYTHMSKVS